MTRNPKLHFWLFSLALAVVILYEYGAAFNFYFVGDDFEHIKFVMDEKARILWSSSAF